MKKTLLSIFTICLLGLTAQAQSSIQIFDGVNSTTNVAGTTINVALSGNSFEGFFKVKNLTNRNLLAKVTRTQINPPSMDMVEELCWGPYPDPNAEGNCVPVDITLASWTSSAKTIASEGNALIEIHFYEIELPANLHYRYYIEDDLGNKLDSVDVKASGALAVKEIKNNTASFNVFPNPASDVINVAIQGSADNSVRIVDVLGKVLYEDKIGMNKKIDVSNFNNGVYVMTIYSNGKVAQTKRLVVRH